MPVREVTVPYSQSGYYFFISYFLIIRWFLFLLVGQIAQSLFCLSSQRICHLPRIIFRIWVLVSVADSYFLLVVVLVIIVFRKGIFVAHRHTNLNMHIQLAHVLLSMELHNIFVVFHFLWEYVRSRNVLQCFFQSYIRRRPVKCFSLFSTLRDNLNTWDFLYLLKLASSLSQARYHW